MLHYEGRKFCVERENTGMLWNKVEILRAVFCVVLYLDNSNLEFTRCYSEFVSCYTTTMGLLKSETSLWISLQLATFTLTDN